MSKAKPTPKTAAPEALTVACVATGASLSMDDVHRLREAGVVRIAVNDAHQLFPFDIHEAGLRTLYYATDYLWIKEHNARVDAGAAGLGRATICPVASAEFGWDLVACLDTHTHGEGLAPPESGAIICGGSSGYAAISCAVKMGATRILLLGYDYGGAAHFFGLHPPQLQSASDWRAMLRPFAKLAEDAAARGIEIINCTPASAITVFKTMALADVLDTAP